MTHDELVTRAARWLIGAKRCRAVFCEIVTYAHDTPDAIGWLGGAQRGCVLIECKTSMADFYAEKQKTRYRRPEYCMGTQRYYFAERGVLKPGFINNGWGLLEVCGKVVRVTKPSGHHESNRDDEIKLLVSACDRYQHNWMRDKIVRG